MIYENKTKLKDESKKMMEKNPVTYRFKPFLLVKDWNLHKQKYHNYPTPKTHNQNVKESRKLTNPTWL